MDRINSNAVYEIAKANEGLAKRIEELEERLKPNSRPSPTDPENSIRCGQCNSDVPIDEDYKYCPYCGQKL